MTLRRASMSRTQFVTVVALMLTVASFLVALCLKTPRPLGQQPQPDSFEYVDSAWHLAHGDGFVTSRPFAAHPGLNPPDKPPGYPLLLAPFTRIGRYPDDAGRGAQMLSLIYPIAVVTAAFAIGGATAALLATIFIWLSPFASTSAVLAMSDAVAAALAVALMPLVERGGRRASIAAGALAGFGVLVRLTSIAILGALLLTLKRRERLLALAGSMPFLAGLAIWQWTNFGAPWRTGYYYWKPNQPLIALHYIWHAGGSEGALFPDRLRPHSWPDQPNWILYPAILVGLLWVFGPPLVGALGLVATVVRRHSPSARLTLWTLVAVTGLQAIYYMQSARFIAAPASMLIVMATVLLADLVERLIRTALDGVRTTGTTARGDQPTSMTIVTGPSFASSTSILAPNTPRSTGTSSASSSSQKRS